MRVLVVDASAEVRSRLVGQLVDGGLDVVGEGNTGASALALVAEHEPDAIVFDVLLPDRRGLDLVPALRMARPSMWLVVVSNASDYRRHCLALGADVFFDKSTEFDAIARVLLAPIV